MTRRRNNWQRANAMRDALTERGMTSGELEAVSELSTDGVMRWLRLMRRDGKVYIERFVEDSRGRIFAPVYRWGHGVDAERPGPRETPAERQRRLRAAKAAA